MFCYKEIQLVFDAHMHLPTDETGWEDKKKIAVGDEKKRC